MTIKIAGKFQEFGASGTIICVGVAFFALSLGWPSVRRRIARFA